MLNERGLTADELAARKIIIHGMKKDKHLIRRRYGDFQLG
jgi:hypothetical protein